MSRLADFSRAETRARNAEQALLLRKEQSVDLEATINVAELYMKALRLAENPVDRKRVDLKCKALLLRAERLKESDNVRAQPRNETPLGGNSRSVIRQDMRQPEQSRKLTTRENIIILEGSKLNGFVFKPWKEAPSPEDFELQEGESLFVDIAELPLSPCQLRSFAGWKRPKEALGRIEISQDGRLLPTEPVMGKVGRVDLVQDMTSDCSVVASLCAATSRAERGHPKVGRILYSLTSLIDYRYLVPSFTHMITNRTCR
jgi:calpain-7